MKQVQADERYWVDREGNFYSTCSGVLVKLKPNYTSKGYVRVSFGSGPYKLLHRVIWETYHGRIPDNLQVRHLNGIKDDNRLVNLAVGTQSDNELDKRNYGADPTGSKHGQATITEDDVVYLRHLWDHGLSARAIKERMGLNMSEGSVHAVATSISWRHVPPATRSKKIKGGVLGYKKTARDC